MFARENGILPIMADVFIDVNAAVMDPRAPAMMFGRGIPACQRASAADLQNCMPDLVPGPCLVVSGIHKSLKRERINATR